MPFYGRTADILSGIEMNESRKPRRKVFAVLAVLLPVVILVIIEVVLRLCGYGYDPSLFAEDTTHCYYYMSPDASRPYFTVKENATQGTRDFFRKEKQDSTLRIFVLGASTNVGFPYMHNGAFPRMLAYRLQMENPGREVEVVNLSLTAVNSVTLRDFARQLVDYQPDAVLIYAGHNEYYGAMGVASTSGAAGEWLNRMTVGLSRFKLGQWAVDFAARIKGTDERLTDGHRNLMERMVGNASIPFGSDAYRRGIDRYRDNMREVLRTLTDAGVPVCYATVSSNLRSLKPFNSAEAEWAEANRMLAAGDSVGAALKFAEARDRDGLRFRAPGEINTAVRKLASEFPGVALVDVDSLFTARSPYGIPGEELFLEHVHPNLRGQALIADAFYNSLGARGVIQRRSEDFDDYPLTAMDEHYGKIQNWLLRENWPFNEPIPDEPPGYVRSFEESVAGALAVKQIGWADAMQMMLEHYMQSGEPSTALKVAEGIWLDNPYSGPAALQAAQVAASAGDVAKTTFYVRRASALGAPAYLTSGLTDTARQNHDETDKSAE